MRNQVRHERPRSLFVLVALSAVVALAFGACSSSPQKWPTAGEARETLSSKYSYQFVHYQNTWRSANGPHTLQISVPDTADSKDQMMVSVYYASYAGFQKDIDNVFAVIAPDAETWEHDVLKQTATTAKLNDQYNASGGLVTVMWDQSLPMLSFVFTGS